MKLQTHHPLFEAARQFPHHPALISDNDTLTYSELFENAWKLIDIEKKSIKELQTFKRFSLSFGISRKEKVSSLPPGMRLSVKDILNS